MLLDVVRFIGTGWHARIRHVGDGERDRFDFAADRIEPCFALLQFVAEPGDFRQQRCDVLALCLRLADGLAARVAQVLQLLRPHLDALALGLQRFDPVRREFEAPGFAQARGEDGGVVAQQGGIEHEGSNGRMDRDYRVPEGRLSGRSLGVCDARPIP